MKKYEMMFIVKATMESDAVKATAESIKKVVTDCEGKVVENIGVLHTFLRNVGMEPNVKDEVIKTLEEAQKLEAEQR